jgi:hypothetical protein
MINQGYAHQDVLGEVYLWGKIIEHEHGYKAQYAYPKKLYVGNQCSDGVMGIDIEALASYIGFVYGVPIEVNAKIAKHAKPDYKYALTPAGELLSNQYKLPPRQMAIIQVLQALQLQQIVTKKDLLNALKVAEANKWVAPLLVGRGSKDSSSVRLDKLFLLYEGRLIADGFITRTI